MERAVGRLGGDEEAKVFNERSQSERCQIGAGHDRRQLVEWSSSAAMAALAAALGAIWQFGRFGRRRIPRPKARFERRTNLRPPKWPYFGSDWGAAADEKPARNRTLGAGFKLESY